MKRSVHKGQVIFVGDRPSKENIDQEVAFIGTKSYKTLLSWIADLDLPLDRIKLLNQSQRKDKIIIQIIGAPSHVLHDSNAKFVALGGEASLTLTELKISHYSLPHPSPKNRVLNDKSFVKRCLKECYEYLRA